jgi:hypothetical protein
MPYALENALFQWREGERRVREAPEREDAVAAVLAELRKRLGGAFLVDELAEHYASGTDWAVDVARAGGAGADASDVVDAAFGRYAREASNYGGGRAREAHERPDRPRR